MNTDKLIAKFTDLLKQADPDIIDVEINITRRSMQYIKTTTKKSWPEEALPEPPVAPAAQEAPGPRPEPEGPDEAKEGPPRHRVAQKGPRLSRSQVAVIKEKLALGARPVALARYYGCSHELISSIRHNRAWKSVPWPEGYNA